MKKPNAIILPIIAGALLFSAAGCASRPEARREIVDTRERPLLPQAAEAFEKGSYAIIEKHLSDEIRQTLTGERFNAMLEDLARSGAVESIVYVTDLENPVISSEIWKIRCRRTGEDGRTVINERLLRVLTGTLDGKIQIIGLMIQ